MAACSVLGFSFRVNRLNSEVGDDQMAVVMSLGNEFAYKAPSTSDILEI